MDAGVNIVQAGIAAKNAVDDPTASNIAIAAAISTAIIFGVAYKATKSKNPKNVAADDVGPRQQPQKVQQQQGKPSTPRLKPSPYGPKAEDIVPDRVPDWSKDQIWDAIIDYETSIASRELKERAFAELGTGSEIQCKAHAARICLEESFLYKLRHALENRKK